MTSDSGKFGLRNGSSGNAKAPGWRSRKRKPSEHRIQRVADCEQAALKQIAENDVERTCVHHRLMDEYVVEHHAELAVERVALDVTEKDRLVKQIRIACAGTVGVAQPHETKSSMDIL